MGGEAKNNASSCMRCGNCCTRFGVCITPFDISRIARATGLEPGAFVNAIPEQEGRERTEPSITIGKKNRLLILKWSMERHCIFFAGSGCGIYKDRPALCRTYPFCAGAGGLKDMKSRACPNGWDPTDEGKAQYLVDIRRYQEELEAYRGIADRWNKSGGGTLKGFLEYASGEISD
jgi:Fe-S-cluster containining protein